MRFNSLKEFRDLVTTGDIIKEGVIPVSEEELNWYKCQLDGLSLEQRMRFGRDLQRPLFLGYELKQV